MFTAEQIAWIARELRKLGELEINEADLTVPRVADHLAERLLEVSPEIEVDVFWRPYHGREV